ncbi:myelin-associated glycoprotein-like [Neolamprologus brichardi]|uniref:myelin-associated glycoprotein-like n=1 Tax=Neolamprologus brichardi TaxID=32507 RepID=UPI001643B017|nr:myelin-associated glycoprotein-like [Neolamprologus brichardi]
MDPTLYSDILSFKTNGALPSGFSTTQKCNFRRKAKNFEVQVTPTEASSWSATVPSSVKGLLGACVVIPCSYNYPYPQTNTTSITGIWYNKDNQVICHSDKSQTSGQFRNRTKLLGDLSKKNCSLMIDDLQQSDVGPLYFRIEIKGYDQYSYKSNKVSVSVIFFVNTGQPDFSVQEEIKEGENVSASCSVFHSCPKYPPSFIWSHSGEQHDQTQQLHEGQWNSTSTLNGPDIKTSSKCSSEDGVVKCECIVESEPPSMVYFILGDRVMQSSKAEKNGFVTIETLQTDFGSLRFVHCLANNMLGYDNILLSLPVNDNMQNILISSGAGVILLIIVIGSGVGVVKKWKMSRKDIPSPDMYTNYPVYGNTDWDESIYANV